MVQHTLASAAGAYLRRQEHSLNSAAAQSGQLLLISSKWKHEKAVFYDCLWLGNRHH